MAIRANSRAGPVTIGVAEMRLTKKSINGKGGQRNEQNERTVSGA